jgi:hypothetical protein
MAGRFDKFSERRYSGSVAASFLLVGVVLGPALVGLSLSASNPTLALVIAVPVVLFLAWLPLSLLSARRETMFRVKRLTLWQRVRSFFGRGEKEEEMEIRPWKRKPLRSGSRGPGSIFIAEPAEPTPIH